MKDDPQCCCYKTRKTPCHVCPTFKVIIIENLKHLVDPRDVEEKITVFVRGITEEKLSYMNIFPVQSKKTPKMQFEVPGYESFEIIPGIRKVFENNCTYVTLVRPKIFKKSPEGNIIISAGTCIGIAQKAKTDVKQIPNLDTELGMNSCEVKICPRADSCILQPSRPNQMQKPKYVLAVIPQFLLDTDRFYAHPAITVKIKHPNLECKVNRVTVQDKGEILLPLRNTGSSILGIKSGTVIGETTSLITQDCISIKLGRTKKKKVIFLVCDLLFDGTTKHPKQFAEIGCFSEHEGIKSCFHVFIT